MKTRFVLALLIGSFAICASSVYASSVRLGSSYGMLTGAPSSSLPNIGTEYLDCYPNTGTPVSSACGGTGEYDLLLQITSSSNLDAPLTIELSGLSSASFNSGTATFGLISCDQGTSSSQLGSVCTPTTGSNQTGVTCSADLASVTPTAGGMITLPASCITLDATFYFDETSPSFIQTSSTPTPEPSSLALIAIGLIPLGVYLKRLQA